MNLQMMPSSAALHGDFSIISSMMCCYCTATMLGELNPVCLREHLLLMTFLACMCDLVKCSWKVQERRGSPSIIKEEDSVLGTVTFIYLHPTLCSLSSYNQNCPASKDLRTQ